MSANLSGNNIDNGDFMIKTCAADPEAGYAKEKFHADPKNGVIISEVDGAKGKRLEFSADWSVVSLDTKLKEGDNIEISEDQQTGKLEISAPDVGKVKTDSDDTFGYLSDKIISGDNISVEQEEGAIVVSCPDLGIVKTEYNDTHPNFLTYKIDQKFPVRTRIVDPYNTGNLKVRIEVADKLSFSQFSEKVGGGGYDDYQKHFGHNIACIYGNVSNDGDSIHGINFCAPRIDNKAFRITIKYKFSGNIANLHLYITSDPEVWTSASDHYMICPVTLYGEASSDPSTEFGLNLGGYAAPLYFLLVCDQEALTDDLKIFDVYISELEE